MLDVAYCAGLGENLVLMDDLSIFVDDLVLDHDVFTDLSVCQDNAALDNCALADGDAAADDGIFHCAVDFAAVGDQGILDLCLIIELGRAGIGCSGVDRPVGGEQGSGLVDVDQSLVCLVVGLQAGDGSEEAVVLDRTDIQLAALGVDDVGQCVDGRGLT